MYDCKECGKNNWQWACEQGIMQGVCKHCGEKTNKFKAHTGKKKKDPDTTKETEVKTETKV